MKTVPGFNSETDDKGKLIVAMTNDELLSYRARCETYIHRCSKAGKQPSENHTLFCNSVGQQILTLKSSEVDPHKLNTDDLAYFEQQCARYMSQPSTSNHTAAFCDTITSIILDLSRGPTIREALDAYSKIFNKLKTENGVTLPPIQGTPSSSEIMKAVDCARGVLSGSITLETASNVINEISKPYTKKPMIA